MVAVALRVEFIKADSWSAENFNSQEFRHFPFSLAALITSRGLTLFAMLTALKDHPRRSLLAGAICGFGGWTRHQFSIARIWTQHKTPEELSTLYTRYYNPPTLPVFPVLRQMTPADMPARLASLITRLSP